MWWDSYVGPMWVPEPLKRLDGIYASPKLMLQPVHYGKVYKVKVKH